MACVLMNTAAAMLRARSLVVAVAIAAGCGRPAPRPPLPPLPREMYARYLEGRLAGYKGNWDEAAESLGAAADAAPDQPMVAVELARALKKAKRTEAALSTLAAARKRWPSHPQVWLVSADLLSSSAPAEAAKAYLRAIELSPDDERAYLGLVRLQSVKAAESTLRILLAHVPASVEGRYRLALALAARNELAAATTQLHAVLERDPDHIDARLDLARALRRQGQLGPAITETRSAFDRSGQALDIAEELFWLLCEADDREAAIDLLTLLDDDRSDAEALAVLVRLNRGLGRLAEARALAARIEHTDREAAEIASAEIALAAGDRAAATAALAAIGADSKRFEAARRLAAEIALAAGDAAAARRAIEPAQGSLDGALIAGLALVDQGQRAAADALIAPFAARTEVAERQAAQLAHARIAERAGDTAGALARLEPLIAAKPDLVVALNLAGYLLADANLRLADAERYLAHARALAPGDPSVLDSWGWLLLRRGDARNAVRALDRAARYAPLEPEILVHLAAAWAADGAPRTAAQVLARAEALSPPPAVARKLAAVRRSLAR